MDKVKKKRIKRFLLDIFFPNRCPFCDKFIMWDEYYCAACWKALPLVGEEICHKCGKAPCICNNELAYDGCYAALYYEGVAIEGILGLKTKNALNAAEVFGEILAKKLPVTKKCDIIVPVPMSLKKQATRGYNQAEEIAAVISEKSGIPLRTTYLTKRDSVAQHTLTAVERTKNAKTEFSGSDKDLSGKTILLCDDVMTTGSTVSECAKILKQMGAKAVFVAVGATTKLKFK